MRVLHIIASMDPEGGGPVEALRTSSDSMLSAGHEVEVVCLDDAGAAYLSLYKFPVHVCPRITKKYGFTLKLHKWLLGNLGRFDVAIIHGLWNHASVGGWRALRKSNAPYVVFAHGMLDPWFKKKYPIKNILKTLFWLFAQGRVLRDAYAVLFTCKQEQINALGQFPGFSYDQKVVVFGTADPINEFLNPRAVSFGERLNGKRYALYMSRIHPKKGCDILIEAFSEVAWKYRDLDLVIAGPDSVGWRAELEFKALKAGLSERIHWTGMLSGEEKWSAYLNADVFVLPSHQENFGIVVAEALACGVPVLLTNKVNIWREIAEDNAGFVDDDTTDGISRLFTRWLSASDDQRDTMRVAARNSFLTRFTQEASTRDLLEILSAAARRSSI